MSIEPMSMPEGESALRERRKEIRRSLSRVNTAWVAVVSVTIVLAVAAAIAAIRSQRQAELTAAANRQAREELWKSYQAQARAGRLSGLLGRKAAGLEAIAAAAAIRPSVDLRDEAIAHLALYDLEPTAVTWTNAPWEGFSTVDRSLSWFVDTDGTASGRVRLWRVGEAGPPAFLGTTNGFVGFGQFSPDSQRLALVHRNKVMAMWDLAARRVLYSVTNIFWFNFNADSSLMLAVSGGSQVQILDVASGSALAQFNATRGRELGGGVFGPDGTNVALLSGAEVEIWDWRESSRLERLVLGQPGRALAWSGEVIAAGDRSGDLYLWNRLTRGERRLSAHQNTVHRLFFSPAGDVLYSTSYDGTSKAWNPRSGRLLFTTSLGSADTASGDGRRVAFRSQVGWSVWNVSAPEGLTTLSTLNGQDPLIWHVDFSPDGRWLAATKRDGARIFDVQAGHPEFFLPMNQGRTTHFIQGGSNLVTTSNHRIAFWAVAATDEVAAGSGDRFRTGPRELLPFTNFTYLEPGTLRADRRRLVLPVSQTEASVIDVENRAEVLRLKGGILPKTSSLSPDGRWVATGTFHGRGTRVWDAASGAVVHEFRDGNSSAYFSPDGRYLVAAGASAYRIYDVGTWRLRHEISTGTGSDLPNLAAFSGDGSLLATVRELNRVELVRPADGMRVASLSAPDPLVVSWMSFAPGDSRLAVATLHDTVQIWDLHRLRTRLAPMGLDWEAAAERLSGGEPAIPLRWADRHGAPPVMVALALGVCIVIACTWFVRHRQHRLLAAYLEVDQRAEHQHRQLVDVQAEIGHAQKMKALGTLAAGIAHDFNNLLSVIRMSNQLNAESAGQRGDWADVAENSAEIEQAVLQGKKLVRSMLGYSREETGDLGTFSVTELVEDTVGLLSKQFLGGITLTLELDRDGPPARGSRNRLEQILLNLIVNASEAMNGRGVLIIAVRFQRSLPTSVVLAPGPAPLWAELSIADSGPGIAPDVLPRIFEPFFTTKHRGAERGTGLGLSTVYTAAQQDGYGLAVESAPGQGARFLLFIPLTPADYERTSCR